jgi:3D (Asp-Asp-Asp) domain-containing protein
MKDLKLVTVSLVATTLLASNLIIGGQYISDSKDYKKQIKDKSELIKQYDEKDKTYTKQLQDLQVQINNQNTQLDQLKKENEDLKKKLQVKREVMNSQRKLVMSASAYTANCKGCTGKTYTGYDVSNTIYYEGRRIIATDFNVISLYSIVRIEYDNTSFEAIVIDKGGAITGNKMDILFGSYQEAIAFGRKNVNVTVIREGRG